MSDFNLQVTVRNAHILRRIRAQYGSNAEMCRETGLAPNQVSSLLTMREQPFRKDGTLTSAAEGLCSALGATPSELWPKEMANIKARRARYEIELTQAKAMAIAGSPETQVMQRQLLEKWMQNVNPADLEVLAMSQSGMTLDEIGREMGRSRERVRQRIAKAERRIREAAYRDGVKAYHEIAGDTP